MRQPETVRVLRIIEYKGPRDWVEKQVLNSIHGTKTVNPGCTITAVTLNEYPELLEEAGAVE